MSLYGNNLKATKTIKECQLCQIEEQQQKSSDKHGS